MAKVKDKETAVATESPAEQIVALLDQVDDAKLKEQIQVIDDQIDEIIGPLKKKRDALNRCRTILRGRKMNADGTLRRKNKGSNGATAAEDGGPLHHGPLLDRIVKRLRIQPGGVAAIAEDLGAFKDDVQGMMESHLDIFTRGRGGQWSLLNPAGA